MSRLFVIADIHGMHNLLINLLNSLYRDHSLDLTSDKLIFTGDMIDRGPDSCKVISTIKELTETYPSNVIALAGNHDLMPVMYYARGRRQDDADLWFQNGGHQTLASYQKDMNLNDMSHDHLVWLAKLPISHTEPGFFFSHAPVPRENRRSIANRGLPITDDELVWGIWGGGGDELGMARNHGNGVIGVCGHIHALRKGKLHPRFYDHYIYADAGAGCSPKAPLCAINLDTREVIYAWPDPVVK